MTEQEFADNIKILHELKKCQADQKEIQKKTKIDLFSLLLPKFESAVLELEKSTNKMMTDSIAKFSHAIKNPVQIDF